ncbi:MAG: calycin-like domain-containing protein [Prevotellaceae bacterium]|nr:calycin-like domain-containing protein [Prevotellaceae bacterium]
MKKLFAFLLFAAALMTTTTFVSCSDDDDDNTVIDNLSGNYSGKDTLSFSVMGMTFNQPSTEEVIYTVKKNNDGTINVVIPQETFDFSAVKMSTMSIGNIVQGSYTVSNIPYNSTKGAYYLDYASQKDSAQVTYFGASKKYEVTDGKITVTFRNDSIIVNNEHQFGVMPMKLNGKFVGKTH